MKRLGLVKPVVTAASVLALTGVAMAQRNGDARGWMGGMSHELVVSANCPQIQITKEKITEDQARDLAQQYADKNLPGFTVERPLVSWFEDEGVPASGTAYGGGYKTVCYKIDSPTTGRYQALYSVEYSIDAKNPAAETRNLRVDQFGYVTEFSGPFGMAGERGPAGPVGPQGAQGPAGPIGPQGQASVAKQWSSFKDFLFDSDKSDIRPNETSKVSEISVYMKQNPSVQVGIDGYADPRGTDQYNQRLSERRVNAIRDALVEAGVSGDKIKTGAFGEQRLLCNEPTAACWQSDRRVEVLISTSK
jgi:outer membrane protein OmpA-like peptidoglycan-associated protein